VKTLSKSRRALLMACAVSALVLGAARQGAQAAGEGAARPPQAAHRPRAIAYAMWNDELLFLAARVEDINITGASDTAMSEAWRDDGVDFYLDMSGAPGGAVNQGCARLAVSAAGGFTALVGTAAGTWRAQPDWLMGLKVGVEREGTLNRADDIDTGYTIEVGIPWRFLGGAPEPGRRIGFNFVVHVRGENDTFVSWSSRAQSLADLDSPCLWGAMLLSPGSKAAVAENDMLICPFTYGAPVVDGRLGASEWLTASVVQLEKPEPELVREPAAGKPGGRLLATYRYDYQVAPPHADDAPLSLAHQPPDGPGPWFSADSVAWHTGMLRQAREAAIDTILPVYNGDPDARRRWSRLGLLRLVQALKQTKDGRMSYPLVGMYLDASCLAPAGAADLTTAGAKQTLWGMIREFFAIVPDEFRAQFDLGADGPANLLVLGPPQGLQNWDGACIDLCRDMYQRAFGSRLLVLGDEAWRERAPNLDGYCSLQPGVGLSYGKDGPRSVVRLSPGYLGPDGMLARHGGQSYEANWMSTLAVVPQFVIVDSLNDYARASEIASSRQYGVRFLDITRQSAQALAGRRQYRIALRRETLPPVLNPGSTYQVELLIENEGFEDLTEGENVEISYALENKQRSDLRRTGVATPRLFVRAGQRTPILVEISTATVDGPLPAGDYRLSFEVTKSTIPILRSKWFARRLFEFSLPVRLGRAPDYRVTVLSTGLPSAMGAGERRRVRVRLRNDGARAWSAKHTVLSYHWVRASAPGSSLRAEPEVVEFEGVRTSLPKDVAPGAMVTMYAWVEARRADGTPLPAWTPDDEWLYQVQWDLVEGQDRWFSRNGGDSCAEAMVVLSSSLGATVVNADLPQSLEAGKTYPVKVLLRNDGSAAWEPDRCALTYRWHYWDGNEAGPAGSVTALAAPVAAGEAALLTAEVKAPDFPGSYRLAWDLVCDGRLASELLDAGSRDMLVQPVVVTGGAFVPLDLAQHVNVFASTYDSYRSRGAFDVAGFSFPAEFIPPDTGTRAEDYPAIYYGGERGWDSLAHVPLRYPAKDQRGSGAVACVGQQIPLPQEPLRALYIAAAASAPVEAEFRIAYPDGAAETTTLRVPAWTDEAPQATVALRTPYVRGTADDLPKPAHIYLLRIGDITRSGAPTALVLPASPHIKIFAITIERQSAQTAGGQ
jgi:hypothetical protein